MTEPLTLAQRLRDDAAAIDDLADDENFPAHFLEQARNYRDSADIAADRIEADAATIASLRDANKALTAERDAALKLANFAYDKGVKSVSAELAEAHVENERLTTMAAVRETEARRVIEPFAAIAGAVFYVDEDGREMNSSRGDDLAVWGFDRVELTYGHLRAARSFLASKEASR